MSPLLWRPARIPQVSSNSDSIIQARTGSLRWWCLSGYHNQLVGSSRPDWANLDHNPDAKCVKANPLRSVYHLCHRDLDIYVKVYRPVGLAAQAKWLIRTVPSKVEFQLLRLARCRFVPTAKPLAWATGCVDGSQVALLVTESLGKTVSLEQLLWQEKPLPDTQFSDILAAAAKAVAQLHCGGIEHRDLHSGNILVDISADPGKAAVYIVDLQKVRLEQRGGHASVDPYRRDRLANVARLLAGMRTRLTHQQCYHFVQSYLVATGSHRHWSDAQINDYLAKLTPIADRQDRFITARYDRRCMRNSRYARKLQLSGGWVARVFLQCRHPKANSLVSQGQYQMEHYQKLFADPEQLLQGGHLIKQGSKNSVIAKEIAIGQSTLPVVIKHSMLASGLRGFCQGFRCSRAMRQWQKAHALIARGIATAWPIAALDHQLGIMLKESVFITEQIPDSKDLKYMLSHDLAGVSRSQRAQLACSIGHILAQLRLKGMRHRDCKASNIVIQHQSGQQGQQEQYLPYLVDLDGVSKRTVSTNGLSIFGVAYAHEAIIRLAASSLESENVTVTDRMRVFFAYIGRLELPETHNRLLRHRLWRCLARKSIAKVAFSRRQQLRKELAITPLDKQEFKNILIIKPSSLGDVVRCLAILSGLRRRYPKAHISWLVRGDCAEIPMAGNGLSSVIEFDRKYYAKMLYSPRATLDFINFACGLHQRRFDLVLDLQGLFRSGFLALCSGAVVRIGFANAREFATCFYSHRVSIPKRGEHIQCEHVVDSYWRFAKLLGFGHYQKDFSMTIGADVHLAVEALLNEYPPTVDNNNYAVLLVGGTEQVKRYPPRQFARVADMISKRHELAIVLLGTGVEEELAGEQLCEHAQSQVVNLIGKTDLRQLIAILGNAKIVVGNDSGPLHIAAALGGPVVGIYGPTDPAVVGPYGPGATVVQAGKDTPRKKRYSKLPEHRIDTITVQSIVEVIDEKLENRPCE